MTMRHMPTVIHRHPTGEVLTDMPTMPVPDFWRALEAIAGRDLTRDEVRRTEEMIEHNWTLRVIAEELFGESRTDAYFAPNQPAQQGE